MPLKKSDGNKAVAETPLLMDVKDVAAMLSVSTRHVWRLADAGIMPKPIKLGGKLVRWVRREVEAWIVGLSADGTTLASASAVDNGCSICSDPNCDNPSGKH